MIEASAGSGKTYTLVELVIRYVLEFNIDLQRILIVTFTNQATNELADRIAVHIQNHLEQAIIEKDQTNINKLIKAQQSCDHINVFTIHKFCQQIISRFGFEGGLPIEVSLHDEQNQKYHSAILNYWRPRNSPIKFF